MTFPIVLAHGVCRFDKAWSDGLGIDNSNDPKLDLLHYFKGLRTKLKNHGFTVYHSNVSWAGGVETRAIELKQNVIQILETEQAEKVNIIAHSMGGLDARHMLFNSRDADRLHERVASLTTISTPMMVLHSRIGESATFLIWSRSHKNSVYVWKDLTILRTDRCWEFNNNPQVIEFETACEKKIQFQTFAGTQKFYGFFDALKLSYYIIEKEEGDNDGLVSVKSSKWRDHYFKGVLQNTDHLNELGWWDPAQIYEDESESELLKRIHNFYLTVARELPWLETIQTRP